MERLVTRGGLANALTGLNRVEQTLDRQALLQTALSNAHTARDAGNFVPAAQEYQIAFALAGELHDASTQAATRVALAEIASIQNDWQTSLNEYNAAAELYDSLEQPQIVAGLAVEQARVTRLLQISQRDTAHFVRDEYARSLQWADAAQAYQNGLALAQELQDPYSIGEFQFELGTIAGAERHWAQAADLFSASALSYERAGCARRRRTRTTNEGVHRARRGTGRCRGLGIGAFELHECVGAR